MRLRVDLLPAADPQGVVVLVDTLRTCTVAPILFDNGLTSLALTPRLKLARRFATETGAVLLGERAGLPPEGFNHGNSPAELRGVRFDGRAAVMVSQNAPTALARLGAVDRLLLGSLYNAEALVERVLELEPETVTLVCSGFDGQEDLDDALTAGFLAARLRQRRPEARYDGAARLAVGLLRAFPDPVEALWDSAAGRYLRGLELGDDLAVAGMVAQSGVVPELRERVERDEGQLFHFTPAAR